MKISLIAAIAKNHAIGINGKMPWHLPADLLHFKRVTLGASVIMGRKTFEAIGKPLPGRENLIVSTNSNYRQPGCQSFTDIASALEHCRWKPEIFIIGGASLYRATLESADFLYLTVLDTEFAGDTFFPEIDFSSWSEIQRQEVFDDKAVDFSYRFLKFKRNNCDRPHE
jgi:dihydrofolate reductase